MDIILPLFLLAENPMEKYIGVEYIYSPLYLSFIMIIVEDDATVLLNTKNVKNVRKTYFYQEETFEFVIIQNNIKLVGGSIAPVINDIEFLDKAFSWYQKYLEWEDANLGL